MKRFLALFLVLLLVPVVCVGDAAIQVSLDKFTDIELVKLYDTVHQEILNRGLETSAVVPAGTYNVKNMFPVGTYRVSLADAYTDSLYVQVTKNETSGGESRYYDYRAPDASYTIVEIEDDDETVYFHKNTVWSPIKGLFD